MSALYEAIKQHAAAEAAAGQWTAVVGILTTPSVEKQSGAKRQLDEVIASVGGAATAEAVLAAFGATEVGRTGVQKLATEGLRFNHPLTIALITGTRDAGGISSATADALLALGKWTVTPCADAGIDEPTPNQAQAAWYAGRDGDKRAAWQERADAAINKLLTSEQADGVAELEAIITEANA